MQSRLTDEATSKSLSPNSYASQDDCQKVPVSDQAHRLKIILSYPSNYNHYLNEQGRSFNLIRKADKSIDPPIETTVKCYLDVQIGLEVYNDELGNL